MSEPQYLKDLNPEQKAAVIQTDGPIMIVAGAGSGKTRVLTYRIAHLIASGVDPFNILSLTFTNKAAREMRQRIEQLVGLEARNIWMGTFHSVFALVGFIVFLPCNIALPSPAPINIYCNESCMWEYLFLFGFSS